MLKLLFEPISIGPLKLKNRIVMPAMTTNFLENGMISQRLIEYYVERAKGGVGTIITQSVLIPEIRGGMKRLSFSIYDDVFIDELRRLSGPIKRAGAKVGIQLSHPGVQIPSDMLGFELVGPSAIPCPIINEKNHELSINEIEKVVSQFGECAQRAGEAGFDVVEFHGAHGYLISEFLSRYFNKRSDLYGGDVENRARFACEIISNARKRIGADVVLGIRINGEDNIEGGNIIEDAKGIAPYLEKAGVDYISVSAGVNASLRASVPSMMQSRGCYAHSAREIRKMVNIPVMAAGRINSPVLAEEILQKGWADLVGMGRALVADPELPIKSKRGDFRGIRKCIACNQGCIETINDEIYKKKHVPFCCLMNPEVGKERALRLKPGKKRKKVLVVGGGPAGMEAATIAAVRGYEVVLMEKRSSLGGQLTLAAKIPFREEIKEGIDYLAYQVERSDISLVMNAEADIKKIEEIFPDVVIIATGATPKTIKMPDEEIDSCTAHDLLEGKVSVGENILIVGGGAIGLETALFLGNEGKKVTVVEKLGKFASGINTINKVYLMHKLSEINVSLMNHTSFLSGDSRGAIIVDRKGKRDLIRGTNNIIWAIGSTSNNKLINVLKEKPYEYHLVGDAMAPRNALHAIREGHEVALRI